MAEIALRTYVKEIDESIEQEQLDQSIAHCRHILETYPKHLDTYRLLGKAYLEAKRYGDAADLFQRVLSAVPDDFVAHVGMSIVREDEGNLDASLWHMERAFETNPANPTIQQELRRLIGRRDGMEPHKVRLTRGALARMYAHGELYQQAVAELRSALNEDPERPDLQVLLANLYWRMNQRQEAFGVSKAILEKLPFCRDANRILATSLQGADKVEEAASYHRRLAALDPYAAFVESAMVEPSTVDAASVRLEKLAWSPGQSLTPLAQGRPVWAASLGAELKSQKPAPAPVNLPSWLESQPAPEPAPIPAPRQPAEGVHPFAGAKAPPEAPIPEWMGEAGWHPSKGEAAEGPVAFSDSELEGLAGPEGVRPAQPLAAAEMPGWLSEISPPSQPAGPAETSEAPPGGGPPQWMKEIQAMATPAAAAAALHAASSKQDETAAGSLTPEARTPESPDESTVDKLERAELPTWLDDVAPGASETIVYWLGDRDKPGSADAEPLDLEASGVPEGAPDWLQEAAAEEVGFEPASSEPKSLPPAELPGWLSGVAIAAAQEPEQANPPELAGLMDETSEPPAQPEFEAEDRGPSAEEAPDWLRSILGSEPEPEDYAQLPDGVDARASAMDAEPSWLEASSEEGQGEEPPDWLARLTAPQEQPAEAELGEALPEPAGDASGAPVASAAAAATSIDWLRGLLEPSPEEQPTPTEGEPEPEAWLEDLAEPAGASSGLPAEAATAAVGSDDWLRGMVSESADEPVESPSFELEQPEWLGRLVASEAAELPGGPLETPDWVKALAAMEPGAVPEQSLEAEELPAPEWLGRVLAPDVEASGEAGPAEDEAMLDEPPPWAQPAEQDLVPAPPGGRAFTGAGSGRLVPGEPERTAAGVASDTPDWLREFADAASDETAAPTTRSAAAAPPPPDLEYEGALDWLREGETGPIGPEEGEGPPPLVASVASTPTGEVDDEEIFRWLEDLAQRQDDEGVPSGVIPRAEMPSVLPAPTPPSRAPIPEDAQAGMEWLDQLAGVQEPAAAMTGTAAATLWGQTTAEVPASPAPIEEVTAVEQTPPTPPQPERPAAPPPEPEEEDITIWLRSLSMAQPEPESPPPVAEPQPAAPAAARGLPAPAAVAPPPPPAEVPPSPEVPPKKPTWTPVDEAWLQPAPPAPAAPPAPEVVLPPVVAPPATAPSAEAAGAARPKLKSPGGADALARARQHLSKGDFDKASKDYATVIKKKYELETVITELRMAAEHFPSEAGLWQLLGDAYMRAERLDEAVDAYNRGIKAG
ncbi:MAG: tetratricopeptide repeat protein [Anaerolineales bacterium]|nr:tetratricopeptide repeat protein [Anaerolineales bacterium]